MIKIIVLEPRDKEGKGKVIQVSYSSFCYKERVMFKLCESDIGKMTSTVDNSVSASVSTLFSSVEVITKELKTRLN